jgi:flagellar hook protein FlgE
MRTSPPSAVRGLTASQKPLNARSHDAAGREAAGPACELTILGNGFFVVRDPASNASYATAARHFRIDSKGCLVTGTGARVQGYADADLSIVGDIQINAAGLPSTSAPDSAMLCHSIDEEGKITVHLSDGTSFLRGQILLQNFQEPQALISEGRQLYSNMSDAGPLPALAAPGSNGLGVIQAGILEFSNAGPMSQAN